MAERGGKNAKKRDSRGGSQARGAFASALGHRPHLPTFVQLNGMVFCRTIGLAGSSGVVV